MDSIQKKVAVAHLLTVQSAAEQFSITLQKFSKIYRDARTALETEDTNKLREKLIEGNLESDKLNRQNEGLIDLLRAWGICAVDYLGEDQVIQVHGKTQVFRAEHQTRIAKI